MMEGGRGRGKGREFGVRAGGEEKPVARIKDPLVGLLWWVGLKAQLCGIKGELAFDPQAQPRVRGSVPCGPC